MNVSENSLDLASGRNPKNRLHPAVSNPVSRIKQMHPYMRCMARLIAGGRPAAKIMAHVKECGSRKQFAEARRNAACLLI